MKRPTEQQVRAGVSLGQWSTSWLIAVSLMVVILGVSVPPDLALAASWAFGILAPSFLVAGMVLCWRLPDDRKWLALVVNLFLVLCGVGLFYFVVERDRAASTDSTLARVRESSAWVTTKEKYDTALANLKALSARVFTQEFATEFRRNEGAKDTAKKEVSDLAAALVTLEGSGGKAVISGATAFDVFGRENAGTVQGIVLAILAVGNEVLALALMWRPKAKSAPAPARVALSDRSGAQQVPVPPAGDRTPAPVIAPRRTAEEYVETARRLGVNGAPAGYRKVVEALGISDREARRLLDEAQEKGLIRRVRPTASPVTV